MSKIFTSIAGAAAWLSAGPLAGVEPGFDLDAFTRQVTGLRLVFKPYYDLTDWPEGSDHFWSLVAWHDEQARDAGEVQL